MHLSTWLCSCPCSNLFRLQSSGPSLCLECFPLSDGWLFSCSGDSTPRILKKLFQEKLAVVVFVWLFIARTAFDLSSFLSASPQTRCLFMQTVRCIYLTLPLHGLCYRSLKSNKIRVLSDFVFSEYSALERLWVCSCCCTLMPGWVIIHVFLHSVRISEAGIYLFFVCFFGDSI